MNNRVRLWLLVGVLAGFATALSVFGSNGEPPSTSTTATTFVGIDIPDLELPTTTLARVLEASPDVALHEAAPGSPFLIPGLALDLVAVLGQEGRGRTLVVIDSGSGEKREADLPAGASDFSIDSSGRVLAFLAATDSTAARWVVPIDLPMRPFLLPEGTGSFVWSGNEPLTAAWLEPDPRATDNRIVLGRFTDSGIMEFDELGTTTDLLVGLNSAGYWLSSQDPARRRDSSFSFRPRQEGTRSRIVADILVPPPFGSRALLAYLDISSWRWNFGLSDDGIDPLAWAPGDAGGKYGFAAFSPDGTRLAFIGTDPSVATGSWLEVWSRYGVSGVRIAIPFRIWDVRWAPDSKFVTMPGTDNAGLHVVVVLDDATDDLHAIVLDDWVQFAALVPHPA